MPAMKAPKSCPTSSAQAAAGRNKSKKWWLVFGPPAILRRRSRSVGAIFLNGTNLDLLGHNVGSAVTPAQQLIGFFVANHLFLLGVEFQHAAKPVRGIGQMYERG